MAVYLGLGVFVANHMFRESFTGSGLSQHWSLYQTGNLGERGAGYALALVARLRGEGETVEWARRLRPNVLQPFRDGLAYVVRTGDTQFRVGADAEERVQTDEQRLERLIAALRSPSSGTRLAALWDLQRLGPRAAAAVDALIPAALAGSRSRRCGRRRPRQLCGGGGADGGVRPCRSWWRRGDAG